MRHQQHMSSSYATQHRSTDTTRVTKSSNLASKKDTTHVIELRNLASKHRHNTCPRATQPSIEAQTQHMSSSYATQHRSTDTTHVIKSSNLASKQGSATVIQPRNLASKHRHNTIHQTTQPSIEAHTQYNTSNHTTQHRSTDTIHTSSQATQHRSTDSIQYIKSSNLASKQGTATVIQPRNLAPKHGREKVIQRTQSTSNKMPSKRSSKPKKVKKSRHVLY